MTDQAERERAKARFARYCALLLEWNAKFNLTAITDPADVEIKHFVDSLNGRRFLFDGAKVCDVGAGAGFPSLPLAIVFPHVVFTLVDALAKRVSFLNEVIADLKLTNCRALHARAEDFAARDRERYDLCVARAVAALNTLSEYCLPLVKIGGKMIAYKGASAQEECAAARGAIAKLGGDAPQLFDCDLPNGDRRTLISVQKIAPTPKMYPRGGNKPKLKPLT